MSLKITINRQRYATIAKGMKPAASALVKRTLFDIEAGCKERSRVDTGQMRNGWQASMDGDLSGTVSNSVDHAIYNEYGTARMSAQPMLHPSMDAARPRFEAGLKDILK